MNKLNLNTEGDTNVIVTRRFAAPPKAVFRAHTDATLMQKWMLGPEGWSMPVCISDAKPGGNIRCEWTDGMGNGFYLTGEYLVVEPYSRTVHIERMFLPDPTPDNHVETRTAMLATGMADGMEASYARLEAIAAGQNGQV